MALKTTPKGTSAARAAGTRAALMREGTRLFALSGYDGVSIREVCAAAKANVASVHYYFGDKEGLYTAILEDFFQKEKELFPSPSLAGAPSLAAFLEDLIFVILSRMHCLRMSRWHAQLVRREMLFPSTCFQERVNAIIAADFAALYQPLRLIAPEAPEDKVRHAVLCVVGQIGSYTTHPDDFLKLAFPGLAFTAEECRRIAQHIVHFAVNGLQAPLADGSKA